MHFSSPRLFIICLTLAYARGTILRLPCQSEAFFTVLMPGKILPNSTIQALPNLSKNECAKACFENTKCKSFNYCTGNGCGCELNSKYVGMLGTMLVDKENWAYMSTDYNATEVGEKCREEKPCGKGILCRDTCDHPFYECVTCDALHEGLHCDIRKDVDECLNSPCKNNGQCQDLVRDYKCNCPSGYTGKNCEINFYECSSFPCQNNAECVDGINGYSCICMPGYKGTNCEIKGEVNP